MKKSQIREYKGNMSDLIFRRILNLLSTGSFDIIISNKTNGEAGYIDYENDTIYLNPNIFPVEETLIHEAIHIMKPEIDEKTVIELSSLLFEKLNNKKRDKLLAYIKALTIRCVGVKKNNLQPTYS
jgi:hypothetical protein